MRLSISVKNLGRIQNFIFNDNSKNRRPNLILQFKSLENLLVTILNAFVFFALLLYQYP